jgi:hypothetical protein
VVGWVIAGSLWAGLAAGCATGPTPGSGDDSGALRPPAPPLYRRTFGTPGGQEWDFVVGSDYFGH